MLNTLSIKRLSAFLLPMAFIGFALIISLMLAVGFLKLAVVFSLMVLGPISLIFLVRFFKTRNDGLFWLLLLIIMCSSLLATITKQSFSFLPTGLLLIFSPVIVLNIIKLNNGFKNSGILLFLLFSFFLVGIVSSIAGRSGFFPAIYTGLIALKPYLMVALGASMLWTARTQWWFKFLVNWFWLPLLAVALLQWFFPSVFHYINTDYLDQVAEINPFFSGYPRATSIFHQPSILAANSAIMALILIVTGLMDRKLIPFMLSGIYFVLILMSGQRQEFLIALAAVPAIVIIYKWRPSLTMLAFGTGLALSVSILLLYLVIPEIIQNELRHWNLSGNGVFVRDLSARAILYSDSVRLAEQYWPLGTGFGTFGSVGAVKFDQSLYVELGYNGFWWFSQASYLMDSYWSKYIAETGWIGFTLQILFYLYVFSVNVKWIRDPAIAADKETFKLCIISFVGLFFVTLTSPTAFNLAEPHGGLIALMFFGLAWQKVVDVKSKSASV